jgi:hypothetical protein
MTRPLLYLLAAATVFAAGEDPWAKVKDLKSGTEIRVVKRGAAKPLEGKLDEARDDAVVIVLKNEQVSVPKDEIDRLDYRPKPGSRIVKTGNAKQTDPDPTPPVGMNHGPAVPGTNYSSGLSIGSKPDYETLYRRPLGAPKK